MGTADASDFRRSEPGREVNGAVSRIKIFLRCFLGRHNMEKDLQDEIQSHLAAEIHLCTNDAPARG